MEGQCLGLEPFGHSYNHLSFNYKSFKMRSKLLSMKPSEFYSFWVILALPEPWYFPFLDFSTLFIISRRLYLQITVLPLPPWHCYIWTTWKSPEKFSLLLCFSMCCGKNWHLRLCLHYLYHFDRLNLNCTIGLLKTCL